MNVPRRRAIQLAAAALAAPQTASAQAAPAPLTLRFGTQPAEFAADVFYGIEQGFFSRAGIAIDLQMLPNGAATSAAILSGALDLGLTDPLTVAEAHLRGIDLAFIAPGAGFAIPWPLAFATRADAGIRVAKDFNGKTIGINGLKNAPAVMSYYWLDHNGGNSQSVKWVEIPFPTAVGAIAEKRIDGELMGEPFISQARDAGLRITMMDHNVAAASWMVNGTVATRAWAAKNPDAVRRFASALHEANRWANTHVPETYPIIAKYTKPRSTSSRR